MTIYEALNWIKEAEYTPCGYIIFNENKPEGQMKGKALKTIFEAAKNDELVPVELFNQVKKERDEAVKNLEAIKQDHRWIPVNGRLPEEKINPYTQDYCSYLCTVNFGGVIDIRYYKYGGGHWCDFLSTMDEYVVAWMPLPEPYKEGK